MEEAWKETLQTDADFLFVRMSLAHSTMTLVFLLLSHG